MRAKKSRARIFPVDHVPGPLRPCATLTALMAPSSLGDNEAMIAPNVVFAISAAHPTSDRPQTVAQTIVAHYRDQSYAFEAQIQITPKHLELAALDGLGRRALTISWNPGGIEHKQAAAWLPPFIRPADILADVAIVYWPDKSLHRRSHGRAPR